MTKEGKTKYNDIINRLLTQIENGKLSRGDQIPSVNELAGIFKVSRDTVLTALSLLKERGVLYAVPGKGYYVESVDVKNNGRIFLLFDELNAFKEDLYSSFLQNLGSKFNVDIFFHHYNQNVFQTLIRENVGKYSYYIIMPGAFSAIEADFKRLPKDKIYLLDRKRPDISDEYPIIYQDFESDVYACLKSGYKRIQKYQTLIMVYPGGKEPEERNTGMIKFCEEFGFKYNIIPPQKKYRAEYGELFLIPSDSDLIQFIKDVRETSYKCGVDYGIISFNDTPLKEVVTGGITTISTDFSGMGQRLAEMIKNNKRDKIANPSSLIVRDSI